MCLLLPAVKEKMSPSLKSLIQIIMHDRRGKVYNKIPTFIFRKSISDIKGAIRVKRKSLSCVEGNDRLGVTGGFIWQFHPTSHRCSEEEGWRTGIFYGRVPPASPAPESLGVFVN